MTPAKMRREAEKEIAKAEHYERLAAYHRTIAEMLTNLAAEMEGRGQVRLPDVPKARRLREKMAQTQADPKRLGRPPRTKHPFALAVYRSGSTIAEWARVFGYDRVTVKSWISAPPAGRRIPRAAAELIEAELGVSATEVVWRNGIKP